MPADTDPSRLAKVLAQHARSSLLMGVDFLPIGQTSAIELAEPTPVIEAKPIAPEPVKPMAVIAEPEPVPPVKPAPEPVRTKPTKRAQTSAGEDSPEAAQALLDELRDRYEREAPHKAFNTDFNKIVFGEGNPRAKLMFVGEAPGADEDRTGRPFVGRAGQLLDKMIVALGITREDVYIANVLKTRPPNNATPTSDECALCAPYLMEQIAIVRPEAIVTLGLPATRTLLNSTDSMANLRGQWAELKAPAVHGLPARTVAVIPTYHPAFLLRAYTKENRQKVWSDLLKAAHKLGLPVATKPSASADGSSE